MISRNKTGLSVAAAALVVGMQIGSPMSAEAAAPSPYQLMQIEKMIAANRVDDLFAFIRANPHLTRGNSALSKAMRDFVTGLEKGTTFSFDGRAARGMAGAIRGSSSNGGADNSIY